MNGITMKNLPFSERPYEKFLKYGGRTMSDAELLAIIIKSGTRGETAVQVAQRVLKECTDDGTGFSLDKISISKLKKIKGIGEVKALQLKAVFEISKRLNSRNGSKKTYVKSPKNVSELLMGELRYEKQEQIKVLALDIKCALIKCETIALGGLNQVSILPREIFRTPIEFGAANIILVHNHPSGDATPSNEDVDFTKAVMNIGEILGIPVLDHIVIGNGTYVSMREKRLILDGG